MSNSKTVSQRIRLFKELDIYNKYSNYEHKSSLTETTLQQVNLFELQFLKYTPAISSGDSEVIATYTFQASLSELFLRLHCICHYLLSFSQKLMTSL